MRSFFNIYMLFTCGLMHCLLLAQQANADDQNAPSFFFNAGGGYAVYKSEMVQSNDTSACVNYGFGV
jgi:hypothetical protein